jgi:hypothetical protein
VRIHHCVFNNQNDSSPTSSGVTRLKRFAIEHFEIPVLCSKYVYGRMNSSCATGQAIGRTRGRRYVFHFVFAVVRYSGVFLFVIYGGGGSKVFGGKEGITSLFVCGITTAICRGQVGGKIKEIFCCKQKRECRIKKHQTTKLAIRPVVLYIRGSRDDTAHLQPSLPVDLLTEEEREGLDTLVKRQETYEVWNTFFVSRAANTRPMTRQSGLKVDTEATSADESSNTEEWETLPNLSVDDLAAAEINCLSPKHFKVGPIMSAITTDAALAFKGKGLEGLTSIDSEDPRKNDESLRTMVQDWNQINVNFDTLTTEVQNLTRLGSMFKTELMDTIKELQDSLVQTDIKVQLIKTHIGDPTDTRLTEPLQVWKALSLLREQTNKSEEELAQLKENLEEQDSLPELKERVESVERALTELVPQLRAVSRTASFGWRQNLGPPR